MIELRHIDGTPDELIATNARVHLEDLGGQWMLVTETRTSRAHLEISARWSLWLAIKDLFNGDGFDGHRTTVHVLEKIEVIET